jgi:cytochrome c oxidase subunit IV
MEMSEQNGHVEHAEGEHEHHIVSPVVYMIVFGCLLVFTGLTVGASYIEMGVFNPIAAIAIACIKMILVVLFFMHVKYTTKLTKLTVAGGFFMFLVLISMTLSDYISRAWGRW